MSYKGTVQEYRQRIRTASGQQPPRVLFDFTGIPHAVTVRANQPELMDVTGHSSGMPQITYSLMDPGGSIELSLGAELDFEESDRIKAAFMRRTPVDIRVTTAVVVGHPVHRTFFNCILRAYRLSSPLFQTQAVQYLEIDWLGERPA